MDPFDKVTMDLERQFLEVLGFAGPFMPQVSFSRGVHAF